MSRTGAPLMSVEEFIVWQQGQEERYERVDGLAVPTRSDAGWGACVSV